jgi:glycosyltransferase involved in cell wall biosynthesis
VDAPLRVVLVTHYYPAHRGGVERIAGLLAERLADKVDITWHASDCDPPPANIRSVPARSWNVTERRWGVPYPFWSPGAVQRLGESIRDSDLVHLHDCLYLPNILAYLGARIARKPVLVTQHLGEVPYRNPLLRAAVSTANRIFGRLVLGGACRVVFESATVQRYFERFVRFRAPPVLIPNGVDTAQFHPSDNRVALRAKLGVPTDRPLLLFLGRFVEKKGLPMLEELTARLPQVHWLFAGWGPLDPARWARANVTVLHSPEPSQIAPLYQAADLFVLPSVGEGIPLALQEAMACGTPALVGDETAAGVPGAGEVLLHEPAADLERWEARIRSLLGEPLERLRPAVAAFARSHWAWERCTNRYAELLRECAA